MKKDLLLLLAVVAMVGITGSAMAQTSATANASATISVPVSITKSADLSFGTLSGGATEGTCVIATDGTRSKTGDVVLLGSAGQNAVFSVAGQKSTSFAITLPTTSTITDSKSNSMTLSAFTARVGSASADGLTGSIPSDGSNVTVKVGATLTVQASQPDGNYVGTFNVAVAYN